MKVLSRILLVVSVAMTTAMEITEVERIADPVYLLFLVLNILHKKNRAYITLTIKKIFVTFILIFF